MTLRVWYILSLIVLQLTLASLPLFSWQLHLPLTQPTLSLLVFSHLFSFQRHRYICRALKEPISWLLFQILLLLLSYAKFPIPLLLSSLSLFSPFLVFSSSFYFYHPNISCFSLHCFLHSSRYLVIFTSSVLQSISGLWKASHSIPKITLHF